MKDSSDRVLQLRHILKLNQSDLGRLAGVSKSAVSQWEHGVTKPNRDAIMQLQRRRNINPNWLINGTGKPFIGERGEEIENEPLHFNGLSSLEKQIIKKYRVQPKNIQQFICNALCVTKKTNE